MSLPRSQVREIVREGASTAHRNFAHFDLGLFLLSSYPALTTSLLQLSYIPELKPALKAFFTRLSSPVYQKSIKLSTVFHT